MAEKDRYGQVQGTGITTVIANTNLPMPGRSVIKCGAGITATDDPIGLTTILDSAAGGLVGIANGGTGQTTAVAGLDALTAVSSNIASAATTDLSTATGVNVNITGTATVTALGTSPAGTVRRCFIVTNGVNFTHNGTSLICPGQTSIFPSAGDTIEFYSLGGGNWKIINWYPAGQTVGGAFLNLNFNSGALGITGSTTPVQWSATAVAVNQPLTLGTRLLERQDAAVASAATITLGSFGNVFSVTGTTAINSITNTGWQAGSVVLLIFATGAAAQVTVAGNIRPRTGAAQQTTPVGAASTLYTMELVFDGTNWIQPA
jgi:hypothetical protein